MDQPAPLVVMLHGAGGNASHALGILQEIADTEGFILVAPAGGTSVASV